MILPLLVAGALTVSPADEVRELLLTQAKAWNRGDLEQFCSVYATDALFLSPSGVTRGRNEVLARYRKRYPDKAAMGALSFEFLETRVDSAVSVAARWKLKYPDKEATGLTLIVLHRRNGRWEIVQDASM